MFSPYGHAELGPGGARQCPAAWQRASPRLNATGKCSYSFQIPGSSSAQLPAAWTSCLGKVKAQGSLSRSSMHTTNVHFLTWDILEMWSVELQPCVPLHHRPTTSLFCPSPPCQVVFDRNTCFCAVRPLCRIRN